MSDSTDTARPLRWPPRPLTDGVVLLDRLTRADAPSVAAACTDPETQRWLPLPSPYTLEDANAYIDMTAELASRGERLVFALRPAGMRELAGSIGFALGEHYPSGVVGIGYWTAPAFRRRGLMWRGVRLAARWAAESVTDLRRIEILVQPGNLASRRVAERAGATLEGLRRNGLTMRQRGVFDVLVFSLLPEEVL